MIFRAFYISSYYSSLTSSLTFVYSTSRTYTRSTSDFEAGFLIDLTTEFI